MLLSERLTNAGPISFAMAQPYRHLPAEKWITCSFVDNDADICIVTQTLKTQDSHAERRLQRVASLKHSMSLRLQPLLNPEERSSKTSL
jgi:hypothetical protein